MNNIPTFATLEAAQAYCVGFIHAALFASANDCMQWPGMAPMQGAQFRMYPDGDHLAYVPYTGEYAEYVEQEWFTIERTAAGYEVHAIP